jgi:hypothetical protein
MIFQLFRIHSQLPDESGVTVERLLSSRWSGHRRRKLLREARFLQSASGEQPVEISEVEFAERIQEFTFRAPG